MTHEHLPFDPLAWAALYAAGALPADEALEFEARLAAGDAACLAALRELDPVVEALATGFEPVAPPDRLKQRLFAQLELEEPGSAPPGTSAETSQTPPPAPVGRRNRDLYIQRAAKARWRESGIPGVMRRVLWLDSERNQYSALLKCAPGAVFPEHVHPGPEEVLLLEGDLTVGDIELGPGDYQRSAAGSLHARQTTRGGCLLLITGMVEEGMVG